MNEAKPDLHVSRKPNLTRMGRGIDIYRNAMRLYIAQQMQHQEPGDWFHSRVIPALPQWRQEEIAEELGNEDPINALDISDFPHVFQNNRKVFPSSLSGKRSKAVTWMYEIRDWRNDYAHPPMDDFSNRDADRALDTCARVLGLAHLEAEKQVRELFDDPQELLKRARLAESQADQNAVQAQQEMRRAQQTKPERSMADPKLQDKLVAYRKQFKDATSGNGWTRTIPVKNWLVTRWVGKARGEHCACVFPPSQNIDGEWVRASEEPLIDQRCNSEEEAFEHLWRAEQSGEIERRAREAIEDYDDPNDSDDDSDSD